MEGGVEKIVNFSYLVYVIIGLAIGPAIDKLVEYVDIVLSYQETLKSLKAKVEDLTPIISLLQKQDLSDDIERQGISAESAVEKWVVKLRHLHRDASAMEQNIARINVVSRYRASKEMKQKISEMEKHLKLFPLIQLKLILRVLILRRRLSGSGASVSKSGASRIMLKSEAYGASRIMSKSGASVSMLGRIGHKLATVLKKRATKSILGRMKMVIYLNREVASLKHLVTSITPIVHEISGIPRLDVYPATDRWCKKMRGLVKEAAKIKSLPWWNVVRRYKDTKDVANLISTIEAHVKSASFMSLEPLFQEKMDLESSTPQLPPKKLRPSGTPAKETPTIREQLYEQISWETLFQEMIDLESSSQQKKLLPSAQVMENSIELDVSNDEGLRAP